MAFCFPFAFFVGAGAGAGAGVECLDGAGAGDGRWEVVRERGFRERARESEWVREWEEDASDCLEALRWTLTTSLRLSMS